MAGSNRYRVAVVDRHQMFTDCLAVALEMHMCDLQKVVVPTECSRTQQVLAAVLAARPAAAVVNTDLGPPCDAIELIAALAGCGVAVVVVDDGSDEARWGHCLAAGARVAVSKSAGLVTMVSVIRRLSLGGRVLELAERDRLLSIYRLRSAEGRAIRHRLGLLSGSEGEILLHLTEGHTVCEIAALRVVSEATVRTQVKAILSKLQVSSQLSAVAVAHAAGWDRATLPAAS